MAKKTYIVTYTETSSGVFYIDAEDEQSAAKEFVRMATECEIDLSDLTVDSSDYTVSEVNDNGNISNERSNKR